MFCDQKSTKIHQNWWILHRKMAILRPNQGKKLAAGWLGAILSIWSQKWTVWCGMQRRKPNIFVHQWKKTENPKSYLCFSDFHQKILNFHRRLKMSINDSNYYLISTKLHQSLKFWDHLYNILSKCLGIYKKGYRILYHIVYRCPPQTIPTP